MNYVVSSISSPFGERVGNDVHTSDIETAVEKWFEFSKEYPTCTSLQPQTQEDGTALLKWALLNFEKLEVWAKEYKCPYKMGWFKETLTAQVNNNKCSMQWEYDELYPFSMG